MYSPKVKREIVRLCITPLNPTFLIGTCEIDYVRDRLVTSVAAMQCVERGLIGLDEPVGKYLPDLEFDKVIEGWREVEGGGPEEPVTRPAKTQLTLRHMLNHTSGLSAAIFDP